MKDLRRLRVWEVAHELTLKTYAATKRFPREELFGLTSQMRRSASSVPMNIAEGCGTGSNAAFAHCLQIAFASSSELDYQLLLAHDLGYLEREAQRPLRDGLAESQRMLNSLIAKVRREA